MGSTLSHRQFRLQEQVGFDTNQKVGGYFIFWLSAFIRS